MSFGGTHSSCNRSQTQDSTAGKIQEEELRPPALKCLLLTARQRFWGMRSHSFEATEWEGPIVRGDSEVLRAQMDSLRPNLLPPPSPSCPPATLKTLQEENRHCKEGGVGTSGQQIIYKWFSKNKKLFIP